MIKEEKVPHIIYLTNIILYSVVFSSNDFLLVISDRIPFKEKLSCLQDQYFSEH